MVSKISQKRRYNNPNHWFTLKIPPEEEMKVRFESRFENANLKKAIKVSDTEYNLILCFDFNTKGHTQWYYFKLMSKLPAGTVLKLRILNLMKPDSLYNYGMKPWVFSQKAFEEKGEEWHRDGHNISYKVNDIIRNKHLIPADADKQTLKKLARHFYTLSFDYTLRYDNDEVYFAHAYPYTYSDHLIPFLDKIANNESYNKFLRIGSLCQTFAGNHWKMLIITENVKAYRNVNEELSWMHKSQAARHLMRLKAVKATLKLPLSKKTTKQQRKYQRFLRKMKKSHNHKKGIVITSRVHPGESQASWIWQGLIEFLISDDPDAIQIRKNFIVKIIPMLNPDGVIYGNYRTSLLGFDLNRRWVDPSRIYEPEIFYSK